MASVTILGAAGEAVVGEAAGWISRSGWLKHMGTAITGASGAAIVLGGYEVLTSQPERAFALLQAWGPAFLIAVIALFLIATIRESFSMVASGVQMSATAAGRTADALTRLAEQGGRQSEQVERLAIYAAQEFPGVYERLDRQDDVLLELVEGMKGLHSMLSKEKAALDLKNKEAEESDGD